VSKGRGRRPDKKPHLRAGLVPASIREVRVGADVGFWKTQAPIWAFNRMVVDGPFGWGRADGATVAWALGRLHLLGSMTWQDILSKTDSHEVDIVSIPNADIARELQRVGLEDIDSLVSLHLGSLPRIWGSRQERTLVILFWDPDHLGWPSIKKHT